MNKYIIIVLSIILIENYNMSFLINKIKEQTSKLFNNNNKLGYISLEDVNKESLMNQFAEFPEKKIQKNF